MKTMFKIKYLIIAFLALSVLNSCVQDDDFEIPNVVCNDPSLAVTKTIQEIFDASTETATQYTFPDVIEGYVTSSDQGGNFFKTISFQTLDGSLGFSVPVDEVDLYTFYNPGRKVFINLQDTYTHIEFDGLEIGALFEGSVGRISSSNYQNVLIKSCDVVNEDQMVNSISLSEINDTHLNTLVEFTGVQFNEAALGKTLYDSNNDLGGATNWDIQDASGASLIFRTSSFADFAGLNVPNGNGTIRGVLTKFRNDYQLIARTFDDVTLDEERKRIGFAENLTGTKVSIADVRALYTGSDTTVLDDLYFEGVITMSGIDNDNMSNRNAYIQDESGAIALRFSSSTSVLRGYQVKVNVKDVLLSEFNGLLQANITQNINVEFVNENVADPAPAMITVADVLTGDYESQLVQIDAVQFSNDVGTFSGGQNVTDCANSVSVYTTTYATFADETYPSGNGTLIGIASVFNSTQILLRDPEDVVGMTGERCEPPTVNTTGIYFSEYAEGSSNNKYFEIYNGTAEIINLDGFAFPNVSNDPTVPGEYEFWNTFAPGATIAPGGIYIVAHPSADASILAEADETFTFLSNGDDGFALVQGTEANYSVIDWLGDWNGDPGSGWEVAGIANGTQNHTLVRKASVTQGNTSWDASRGTNTDDSEWIVLDIDDWTNLGVR